MIEYPAAPLGWRVVDFFTLITVPTDPHEIVRPATDEDPEWARHATEREAWRRVKEYWPMLLEKAKLELRLLRENDALKNALKDWRVNWIRVAELRIAIAEAALRLCPND